MVPFPGSDADYFKDKARRDLLNLLEGVSKAPGCHNLPSFPG
jgi:hypothetical protein